MFHDKSRKQPRSPLSRTELNDEELLLLKVHLSQIICCLLTLKNGGSFVIKTFLPIQTKLGISIMYTLYKSFEELYFYKPSLKQLSNQQFLFYLC